MFLRGRGIGLSLMRVICLLFLIIISVFFVVSVFVLFMRLWERVLLIICLGVLR